MSWYWSSDRSHSNRTKKNIISVSIGTAKKLRRDKIWGHSYWLKNTKQQKVRMMQNGGKTEMFESWFDHRFSISRILLFDLKYIKIQDQIRINILTIYQLETRTIEYFELRINISNPIFSNMHPIMIIILINSLDQINWDHFLMRDRFSTDFCFQDLSMSLILISHAFPQLLEDGTILPLGIYPEFFLSSLVAILRKSLIILFQLILVLIPVPTFPLSLDYW